MFYGEKEWLAQLKLLGELEYQYRMSESGPKRSIAFYVCLVEYHLIKAQIILQPQDSRLKGIEDGFEVQGAQ
jgi:hypothetical protein